MKLVFIVANLKGGGVQRVVCNLANTAFRRGIDVEVLALTRLNDGHLKFDGVPVTVLGGSSVKSSAMTLSRILAHAGKDVVIITGQPHVNLMVLFLKLLTRSKAKLFITEHNPLDIYLTFKEGVIQKTKWLFYRYSTGIICVAEAIEKSFRDRYGLKDHPIRTISNPVVPPSHPLIVPRQSESRDPDAPFVIICIGRLHYQKNFSLAIEAASDLLRSGVNVFLRIVGEGPERSMLERLAREKLPGHTYVFEGFQSDVYAVLRDADCLLVSSRWEGFGLVVIEALLCGVNVVTTRCPGPCEILADGEFGRIADHNAASLAQAIRDAMNAPLSAEKLRLRGMEISDPEQVFDHYIEFIEAHV